MRIPILFALGALTMFRSYGQTTIVDDAANLLAQNKCDAAIIKLEAAPAEIQNTPYYLKTLARAHDCTNHPSIAIKYYNKYLQQTSDDSVKKRVTVLMEAEKGRQDEQNIKAQFHRSANLKHKKTAGNTSYIGFAAAVDIYDGAASPYAYAIRYSVEYGQPLIGKKVGLNLSAGITATGDGRKKWFERVIADPQTSVSDGGMGWGFDLCATIPYWLVNNRKIALGVAPMLGYKYLHIGAPEIMGFDDFRLPELKGLTAGIESVFYYDASYVSIGYNWFGKRSGPIAPGGPDFRAIQNSVTIKLGIRKWHW